MSLRLVSRVFHWRPEPFPNYPPPHAKITIIIKTRSALPTKIIGIGQALGLPLLLPSLKVQAISVRGRMSGESRASQPEL